MVDSAITELGSENGRCLPFNLWKCSFIRKFSDVIVLLIPVNTIIIVFFVCYRRVFLMCRLSTQKIQWQQNDKTGSFRDE